MKTTKKNNVSLAVSLAKEKSRNEKLLAVQQELIASRNEALMRLNETEALFDRMGIAIKRGIGQLYEMANSMEDLFAEISRSQKSLRDSANTRSSLRTKVHRKRAAPLGTSKTQTVNPMVGGHTIITHPRISLSRIDDLRENAASDRARNRVLVTPVSVSAFKEESEPTDSDTDSTGAGTAPPSPRRETMQEFYERAYAQDAQEGPSTRRSCRRRPTWPGHVRSVPKPRRNAADTSSSDECDSNHVGRRLPAVDKPSSPTLGTDTTAELNGAASRAEDLSIHVVLPTPNLCDSVAALSTVPALVTSLPSLDNIDDANIRSPRSDSPDFLGFSSDESRNYGSLMMKKPRYTISPKPSLPTSAFVHEKRSTSADLLNTATSITKTPLKSGLPNGNIPHNSESMIKDSAFLTEMNFIKNNDSSAITVNSSKSKSPSFSELSESSLNIDLIYEHLDDDASKSLRSNLSCTPTKSCAVFLSNIEPLKLIPSSTTSQIPPVSPKVYESSATPTKSCAVLLSNIEPMKPLPSPTSPQTCPVSPKVYESSATPTKSCAVLLSNIEPMKPLPSPTSPQTCPVSPKVYESSATPTKSCAVLLSNIEPMKPLPSPTSPQACPVSPKVYESSATPTKSCAVLLSNIEPMKPLPSPTSPQTCPVSPKVYESSATPTKSCAVLLSNIDSLKPITSPTSSQTCPVSAILYDSTVVSSTPTKSCAVLLSNIDPLLPLPPPITSQIPPVSPKVHASIDLSSICTISTASSGQNTQPIFIVNLERLPLRNSGQEGPITLVSGGCRPATPLHPLVKKGTQSAKECKRVLTIELERLPTMSKSADSLRNPQRQTLKAPDCCSNVENITELKEMPRRRGKRNAAFSLDPSETPSRGMSKIPNLRALVKQIDDSCKISDLRVNEDQGARRVLRKIAPTNTEPRKLRQRRRPLLKT